MEKKARLKYLDLIKTLAIMGVCTLHYDWAGDMDFAVELSLLPAMRRFFFAVYSAAVPLLMMTNGALLLNRPFNAKKHLFRTLALAGQYVFWRAVSIVLIGLYQGIDFSQYNLTALVNSLLLLKEFEGVNLNHLWFMPMLICLYLWVPLIKAAFDRMAQERGGIWIFLPFMGFLAVFCLLADDVLLIQPAIPFFSAAWLNSLRLFQPLSSSLYSAMLFYFILGGLMFRYAEKLRKLPGWMLWLSAGAALLLLYLEWRLNSALSNETYDNVFNSYDNLPCAVLTAALFALLQRTEKGLKKRSGLCRLCTAVGSNTMSIYYFHWIIAATVLERLHAADGFIVNAARGALLCLVCTLISMLLKKVPGVRRLLH